MKTVLIWIAAIAVLALPLAMYGGLVYWWMAAYPGTGVVAASWAVLKGVLAGMVPLTAGRLTHRMFQRPK